ncbi:hypothetical protein BDQ94DRAFT_149886 [Aspergillus welwitschiae]|uniref:Uncharacterized protein n=1 Tax=Aspergillus welwitschiae TaxID=1341132 RepID=A0A3F3PSF5_9EURO|nr:hypothetical protein BDQ94DRAFT_149886 [Aspergillus welwitschiae]RDH29803.1 hypothetical protein BDQ94DRAFT_149886 [Aspergillus welwitschiae]
MHYFVFACSVSRYDKRGGNHAVVFCFSLIVALFRCLIFLPVTDGLGLAGSQPCPGSIRAFSHGLHVDANNRH